jgi:restriction system protein
MGGLKRNEGLLNDLYDLLVAAPRWLGPVLAALSYPCFRYLVPGLVPKGQLDPLAALVRGLAWMAPVLVLMVWLAAEVRKLTDRRRLDRTRGLGDVHGMSWSEFESLVAEAYRRQGYSVEHTGSAAGDGGVDLILHKGGRETLVQCKHWRNQRVGVKVVRELCGAMADAGATNGIIVCYGSYTREAEDFARNNAMQLVDGRALERMIRAVKKGGPPAGLAEAALPALQPEEKGAETAPPCPKCGSEMVLRTSRQGKNAGGKFWGCPRYPACRGIRQLD